MDYYFNNNDKKINELIVAAAGKLELEEKPDPGALLTSQEKLPVDSRTEIKESTWQIRLSSMPGCCGINVVHNLNILHYLENKGLGSAALSLTESIGTIAKVGCLLATCHLAQDKAIRLLKKSGWTCIDWFQNPKTGNIVLLWMKHLAPPQLMHPKTRQLLSKVLTMVGSEHLIPEVAEPSKPTEEAKEELTALESSI